MSPEERLEFYHAIDRRYDDVHGRPVRTSPAAVGLDDPAAGEVLPDGGDGST